MKHGGKKTVVVVGYEFDCLPGHVRITGRGSASTLKVAAGRAIEDLLWSHELKHKQVHSFKVSVAVETAAILVEDRLSKRERDSAADDKTQRRAESGFAQ